MVITLQLGKFTKNITLKMGGFMMYKLYLNKVVLNIHIQENFLDIYKNKGHERNWVGWLYQTHEPRVLVTDDTEA